MTRTLLESCRLVVTMDDGGTELPAASIVIEDGWIQSVGPRPDGEFDRIIDCKDRVVIPGLINTHHHLYQTLTRAFPESRGQTLFPWLRQLYPIWAGLDEDMVAVSTRAGLAELALSGCTTSSDHLYVFPPGSENFIDAQVAAAQDIGVRFHATRGSMDLSEKDGGLPPDSVVQSIEEILTDSERVINAYHDPSPGAMTRIALAPCSPFSVTPDLMRESAMLARQHGVRLHTHIAETMDEDVYSRQEFGVSPIELLNTLGWLGDDVWVAHCVHPTDKDIGNMARTRTGVAHCPTSNMLLSSGLAPVRRFLQEGIPTGIGVDGSASNDANNLRAEVKQVVLASRIRDGVEAMPVRDALRIATRGSAECLGRDDIGIIEAGKVADLVLFDTDSLETAGGEEDLVAAIVLCDARPHTVMVHGNPIVELGALTKCDRADLARSQIHASRRLMERSRLH